MEFIKSSSNGTEEEQLEFYEQIFNALADKIRLKILHSIRQSNTKSLCVCDLEELLELKQSKLSYHLKKLSRCKYPHCRKTMAHGIIIKLMNNKYR